MTHIDIYTPELFRTSRAKLAMVCLRRARTEEQRERARNALFRVAVAEARFRARVG